MSKFIEELYYGNIDMQEASNAFTPKAKSKFKELIEREEDVKKLLPEEAKKLFAEYADVYSDYVHFSNIEKFIAGFRIGAGFTYDTFKDTD